MKNPNPNLTSTQPHTYFYRSMHEPDDDDIKHTLQCSTTDLLKTTNLRKIQKNKPNDSFSAFLIDSSPHGRSEMYRMARWRILDSLSVFRQYESLASSSEFVKKKLFKKTSKDSLTTN